MKVDQVYRNIKKRRIELHMSQRALSATLGYKHSSSINKIELGVNDIPMRKVEEFATALDTTVEALMGWEQFSQRRINLNKEIKALYGRDAVRLLEDFSKLNFNGQKTALTQLSDLTEIHKYMNKEKYKIREKEEETDEKTDEETTDNN